LYEWSFCSPAMFQKGIHSANVSTDCNWFIAGSEMHKKGWTEAIKEG
jgi:hypothetical protein